MWQVLFGLALITVGAVAIWTSDRWLLFLVGGIGAIAAGIHSVILGYLNTRAYLRQSRITRQLESLRSELTSHILAGKTIDDIARIFDEDYGIAPTSTRQVAASLMLSQLDSGKRDLAFGVQLVATSQRRDSHEPPDALLERLSLRDSVYRLDDFVTAYTDVPAERAGAEGTAVLADGYLYFLEKGTRGEMGLDRNAQTAVDHAVPPPLSIALEMLTAAVNSIESVSGMLSLHSGSLEHLRLQARFGLEHSFAFPLGEISRVRCVRHRDRATRAYLEVSGHSVTTGRKWQFFLGTTSRSQIEWAREWLLLIRRAAFVEGLLLVGYRDRAEHPSALESAESALVVEDGLAAATLTPSSAEDYSDRGGMQAQLGRMDLALLDFDEALRLNAGLVAAWVHRGNCYLAFGELDRAIQDYDEAIRLDPHYPDAYCNRGIAFRHRGDIERALADYDMALTLEPGHRLAERGRRELIDASSRPLT